MSPPVLDWVLSALLSPLGLPTLLFVLLLAAMRWDLPFTGVGGGLLATGTAAFAILLWLRAPALVGRIADPGVAPALALALGSAAVTWIGVRDLRRKGAGEAADDTGPTPGGADLVAAAAVFAGLVVLAVAAPVPLGPPADPAAPSGLLQPPWWAAGWSELATIVRPAMGLALLSLLALAALPWLGADPDDGDTDPAAVRTALDERRYGVRLFLFGWWILGVGPIVVGAWLRGPGWRPLGLDGRPIPGSAWSRSLAELVWLERLGIGLPSSPLVRELPGLLVLAAVLVALPVVALRRGRGRGIARRYRRSIGGVRFGIGVALALGMVLLAGKIWLLGLLRIRALVDLAEIGVAF